MRAFLHVQVLPGIVICRVDAPMYFANIQYIHDRVRKYQAKAKAYSQSEGVAVHYVIIEMSPVTHMDSTGIHLLETLHQELADQGIQLILCNPSTPVVEIFERAGLPDVLGREWIFVRVHDAVMFCQRQMQEQGIMVTPCVCPVDVADGDGPPGVDGGIMGLGRHWSAPLPVHT